MKRFYILLALLLCAMMVFGAQAETYSPGDEVQIPIYVSSSNAHQVTLKLSIDGALEFVSMKSSYGQGGANRLALFDINDPLNGQVATMTCKIKEDAKSGTYGIQVTVLEAWTLDEDYANASASAGTVTVYAACTHDKTEDKVTKEATCEATGTKQIVCADCGEVMGTETIDALGHDMGEWKETKAPACEVKGEETATCTRCGKTETREVKALDHEFGEWTQTKAPACEVKGEETSTCTLCGKTETREVKALDHEFGEWTQTKAPACEVKGEETSTCALCGKTETREVEALDHEFGEWTQTKAPACEVKGEETSTCALCGKTETREVEALDHEFGEWTQTKAPACEVKGEETSTCALCGKTETREIAALGHDVGEWVETKAPTCTEKGEETYTCALCGKTETREIAALGHDVGEWVVTKEATCEEDGAKYRECSRCNEREDVVVPALGHNAVWKIIKPATNKEEGLKQKICKRCDKVLDEQIIPIRRVVYKTACTAGVKLSEIAKLIDKNDWWKMVTPIDLSVEGTTRYPLVSGNVYEIGYVEVTVADGVVTADLVVEAKVTMYTSALIFLSDAGEIKRFTANDYEHYEFPASINLSDLPADKLYMMVSCQLTIDESKPEPKYYNFKGAEHAALIEQVNAIIAEMNAAE